MTFDSAASIPADTSQRVYELTVTVPAGTLPAAPQVTPWITENNVVVSIEIEIPPGHNGLTGIAIMKGGTQLLPFSSASWIIANDYVHTWPIEKVMGTGDITVNTYNQGAYPHTFYLRMTMTNYYPPAGTAGATEADALPLGQPSVSSDPLSPDVVIGSGTTQALLDGSVTPADLAPSGP